MRSLSRAPPLAAKVVTGAAKIVKCRPGRPIEPTACGHAEIDPAIAEAVRGLRARG
jgi:hypothetical protein